MIQFTKGAYLSRSSPFSVNRKRVAARAACSASMPRFEQDSDMSSDATMMASDGTLPRKFPSVIDDVTRKPSVKPK